MPSTVRAALCALVFLFAADALAAEWQPNTFYAVGAQVTYQGPLYECITAHTSQVGWEPNVATSLWRLVGGTPTATPPPTTVSTPTPTPTPSGAIEITPGSAGVTASTQDQNVPANTVDNSLSTRWSGNGDGAWIRYDLGVIRTVAHVRVAVHQGNARRNSFDLQVSTDGTTWATVFSGQSSGTTTLEQTYDFTDRSARYVRYVGHGATFNAGGTSTWNSVSEVSIFAPGGTPCPSPTAIPTPRPIGLAAAGGDAQVSLTWQSGVASTGAHTYEVLRSTTAGGPYALVATVNASGSRDGSHVDTGLTNGTRYFYVVREVYSWTYTCSGQNFRVPSGNSDEASALPQAGATPTATRTPTPTPTPTATPTRTPTPCCSAPIEVTPGGASVTASANDGNLPANTVDGSLSTRWSANGDGQWIKYDLGVPRQITHVTIAVYSGNLRQARFDIQVSNDNMTWSNVLTGGLSRGTTTQEQYFDVDDASARWVRYLGHGNTVNAWNSLLEVSVFAMSDGSVSPTPTRTPTPSPTPTPTPTPTGSPSTGFPARLTAPYIDALAWPTFSMTNAAAATGNKYYTLAFFQDGGSCTPKWGGVIPLADNHYLDQISSLRASGGDVIMSFGGASGMELAQACSTVSALQAAYQSVISHYQFKWIDLDIEGAAIADTAANDRRNKALRGLQLANPSLRVSYTLPVMPDGLTQYGLDLLRNAKANGVRVDVVNVMAMDYGPCIDMGQAAIDAARNTNAQMGQIALATKIGVTPMIGVNDVTCEVFHLSDADQLLAYAQANTYISELAFWSMNRDNGDCAGSGSANPKCSGISQSLFAFTNKLKAFR